MDKKEFKDCTTFLSSNIKELFDSSVTDRGVVNDASSADLSVNDVLLKLNENILNCGDVSRQNVDKARSLLMQFSLHNDLPSESIAPNPVLLRCLRRLQEPSVAKHYIGILQISAAMERILACVYRLRGKTPPFLLRDLVNTEEVESLVGRPLVDFMKVCIASVHGLNVRNLAWHGFLSVEDVHREHAALMLFTLHKCGEELAKRKLKVESPPSPSFVEPCLQLETYSKKFDFSVNPLAMIRNSRLIHSSLLPFWEELVECISKRDSDSILLLLPLLENALRTLFTIVNKCPFRILSATNSSFYITMDEILSPCFTPAAQDVTLPPSLNLPSEEVKQEDYFLTPPAASLNKEVTELNVAGDVKTVPNLVPQYLGRQLTEALYDLFHYISGPRLRDRISHGMIMPEEVPFDVIRHLFWLYLLVLSADKWRFRSLWDVSSPEEHAVQSKSSLFTISCVCESLNAELISKSCVVHYSSETENVLMDLLGTDPLTASTICTDTKSLVSYIRSYECLFHPVYTLKQSLVKVLKDLKKWKEWGCPPREELPDFSWERNVLPFQAVNWSFKFGSFCVKCPSEIDNVLKDLISTTPASLFSSKVELKLILMLQQIARSLQMSLDNIRSSLTTRCFQLSTKALRSRQRESFFKQVKSLPEVVFHVFVSVQMICFILSFAHNWKCCDVSLSFPLQRLLKNVLKTADNLASFTQPSVNKYHEVIAILENNTRDINQFFTHT